MNVWSLPVSVDIGGENYSISADFRDVLEIIEILNDQSKPKFLRWQIAIALFYDRDIPAQFQKEAMEYLSAFISYGNDEKKPGPKLIDWNQDAQTIVSDVNKVAGMEIRAVKFLHWWTFLSYFYGVGEGQLSTIVSIRNKKFRGKKLEKWEDTYYQENKEKIDFKKPQTAEDLAAQAYFDKWL